MIAKQYLMRAQDGDGAALRLALEALAESVRKLPGCQRVELLGDLSDEHRFLFTEQWPDIDMHLASAKLMPKDDLARVLAALREPPASAHFAYLKTC